MPNVIFSEKQLPTYTNIDKYTPYHTETSKIIFSEIEVFREILKDEESQFEFFANSFLVEASKSEIKNEFRYISFNNMRKEKYQLITKIADTYVEKQMVSKASQEHYNNIKENMKLLENRGIKLLDYVENETIKSKYVEQKYMLDNIIVSKIENKETKELEEIISRYIKIISEDAKKGIEYEETIFGKLGIEIEDKNILNDLHYLKNGLWDMIFTNCFYIDNEFVFFDQEWNMPNVPYEYILYRSIFYTLDIRNLAEKDELYKKYNLTKYIELFKQLEDKLQEEILDKETKDFYAQNTKFNIDETMQEMENLNIRSQAQQGAIDNFQKQIEEIIENNKENEQKYIEENQKLLNEYNKAKNDYLLYRESIESKLFMKIYRKLRGNK